jgi:AraC family transcriptional regulator, transcriptional activator of pobA
MITSLKKIPEIKFSKKQNPGMDLEVIPLLNICQRYYNNHHSNEIQSFHRDNFNTIIFIEEGAGKHFIDFCTYKYQSGDLIFVTQNQVQAYEANENIKGWVILFTNDYLMNGLVHQEVRSINNLLRNIHKSPIIRNIGNNETIRNLISIISKEYKDDIKKSEYEIFRHLLMSLIIKLENIQHENLGENANTEWQKVMNLFDKYIIDDSYQCRNAESYARKINCSFKHLNMVCKALTGFTAKKYIDYSITLEIKRQLATTNLNTKELCNYFCFDEETNFIKYFKKKSGYSPKAFRGKLLK